MTNFSCKKFLATKKFSFCHIFEKSCTQKKKKKKKAVTTTLAHQVSSKNQVSQNVYVMSIFSHPDSVSLVQSIGLFLKLVPCWAPLWTVVWLLISSCSSSAKSSKKKKTLSIWFCTLRWRKLLWIVIMSLWLFHQNLKWVNVERGI